jgi:hypothetical protein
MSSTDATRTWPSRSHLFAGIFEAYLDVARWMLMRDQSRFLFEVYHESFDQAVGFLG